MPIGGKIHERKVVVGTYKESSVDRQQSFLSCAVREMSVVRGAISTVAVLCVPTLFP